VDGAERAAIVFAAAPVQPAERLRRRLAALPNPYVVAADEGAATALRFGYTPDVVIGDFDSLDAATLTELRRLGVVIDSYPPDKDDTDGQLAVRRALELQPASLWLLGFVGGPRLDQTVANVLLLVRETARTVLLDERNECRLVRPEVDFAWLAEPGEVVSLLPLGGDVSGVHTAGLRWSLAGATLTFGDTRGVSNEPITDAVSVSIERGLLLVTRHFPE
jgi:thiamine pyrophosphokinase